MLQMETLPEDVVPNAIAKGVVAVSASPAGRLHAAGRPDATRVRKPPIKGTL